MHRPLRFGVIGLQQVFERLSMQDAMAVLMLCGLVNDLEEMCARVATNIAIEDAQELALKHGGVVRLNVCQAWTMPWFPEHPKAIFGVERIRKQHVHKVFIVVNRQDIWPRQRDRRTRGDVVRRVSSFCVCSIHPSPFVPAQGSRPRAAPWCVC